MAFESSHNASSEHFEFVSHNTRRSLTRMVEIQDVVDFQKSFNPTCDIWSSWLCHKDDVGNMAMFSDTSRLFTTLSGYKLLYLTP